MRAPTHLSYHVLSQAYKPTRIPLARAIGFGKVARDVAICGNAVGASIASTIAKWIASSAAESVPAQAIVAVPGWYTATDTKFPAVWVLNTRGIKAFIEKCPPTLSPEQIQRIAFQLENHCRLKKE